MRVGVGDCVSERHRGKHRQEEVGDIKRGGRGHKGRKEKGEKRIKTRQGDPD